MIASLKNGKTIFWCGNGGSAADAQHLAAELVGRFLVNRRAFKSIALTTDTSILTAVANDFGYERVFARQLEALANSGDLLVAISTSGESLNIVNALRAGRLLGLTTVLLTGMSESTSSNEADLVFHAQSNLTSHIQEVHIAVGQALCGKIERDLTAKS